ncbi:hypothetical protein LCGC14_2360710 [marine sediment metagenome]|uniref:Uncharacterized protein n=1 Tax=marine sediment metagenome TaxID=412755 RepID=A0A0F9F1K3_9ZZZZ
MTDKPKSMIKRCEQAISALFPDNTTLQAYYGPDDYEIIDETALVRAVIEEMRWLTPEMIKVGDQAWREEKTASYIFRIMADKALEDG